MRKKLFIPLIAIVAFLGTVSFQSDFFEIAKQIEIFTTLFKEINMNYVDETNPAELMDDAIEGMLDGLDPYTRYWTEQEVEDAKISRSGDYSGIGATVSTKDKKMIIVEPRKGYPADKAGLKAGDEIIKIGEITVSEIEGDARDLLKGSAGSSIALTYLRQGKKKTTMVKRGAIEIDAVPFYELIDGETGYIVLTKFNRKAAAQVKEAVTSLKTDGATKIVLDLRGNPGGLLSEAVKICGHFLPKGSVVTTTKSVIKKYNKTYKTSNEPIDTEIPLAVLINGRSASASEIVSGGLQDYDRAVIVGTRSFGKGLVQRPKPLTYGTQLKVTISRYYTPSGRCIQALDYWNRDSEGNAVRTDKKDFKKFKTANGRSVFDGGGVFPDIEISSAKTSALTKALLKDKAIFEFATQYYYNHQYANLNEFSFTDADYKEFKQFLNKTGFNYETETESAFAKALEQAKKDKLDKSISTAYSNLQNSITESKNASLDIHKTEIQTQLINEIITRYFYKDGLYNYQIANNEEIAVAVAVLGDLKRYTNILK